jgi:hypothetical protein
MWTCLAFLHAKTGDLIRKLIVFAVKRENIESGMLSQIISHLCSFLGLRLAEEKTSLFSAAILKKEYDLESFIGQ